MPIPRSPKFYRKLTFGVLVALAGTLALIGACGSNNDNPGALGDGTGTGFDSSLPATCSAGKAGCACSTPGQTVACGRLESQYGSYVTCQEGYSTCENGAWGACKGDVVVQKSLRAVSVDRESGRIIQHNAIGPCSDPCDPNSCTQTTDGPGDVPDGAQVVITDAGVTLPPTTVILAADGGIYGDGATCTGLQCQVDWGCPVNSMTTLTGTVYDPAMQNPLYNAYVYIPVDPNPADIPPFGTGATCDTCAGVTLDAVSVAQTDVNGNFTLTNVPATNYGAGAAIPLVVQMGKWRRVQLLTTVPSCTTTAVPVASSRLPQSKFDGWNNQADIPHMAIASGSADPFECMMLKMGISPAEFQIPGSGTRRIDYYTSNGQQYQGGSAPYYSSLVGSVADLMPYDIVILPCEGGQDNGNESYSDNVVKYANAGGRMFTTHYGYTWLATPNGGSNGGDPTNPVTGNANPFYKVATWNYDSQANTATAQVDTNFPKGAVLETWLDQLPAPNVGAVTAGSFLVNSPRHDVNAVNGTYATQWIHDISWESPRPLSFTYNTPVGPVDAGPDSGVGACGRVVYSDFHVSTADIISGNSCTSSANCGYGSTCNGGHVGTCTPKSCVTNASCPNTTYTCTGGVAGTCQQPASQCNSFFNCYGGNCISHQCTCTSSAQCGGAPCVGGICGSSGASCTSTAACAGDQVCSGLTTGSCTHTCAVNSDCPGGELCESGSCTGCSSHSNCPSNSCVGATNGTCSGNSGEFPNSCIQGPMNVQESALEFMLLDLSACVSPDDAPPPPPPTPVVNYSPATFTLDFTSSCAAGSTHARWTELDWQANIPASASIVFSGQTVDPPSDGGPPNFTGAQIVQIADATATTPGLPTGWNAALIDVSPVDAGVGGAFNNASPPVLSKADFQLTITLNPSADKTQTPTLIAWQIKSDCPPSE